MLRGGLAGLGARGGLGAKDGADVPPPFGWEAFKRRDPGGALVLGDTGAEDPTIVTATPLYGWGLRQFVGTSPWEGMALADAQGGGLANAIYCLAEPLPAGRIQRLLWACTGNANASGKIRMGVYSARGGSGSLNLYPDQLLYDSGEIAFTTLGVKSAGAISGGLGVDTGLYFSALTCDTDAAAAIAAGVGVAENFIYPVNGNTVRFGNGEPTYNSSLCVGWRHAASFAALPTTFPDSAPKKLVVAAGNATIPMIFYGFDPD